MLNHIKTITRRESINSKKDNDNHAHKNKYNKDCITLNTCPQIGIYMTIKKKDFNNSLKVCHQNISCWKDKLNKLILFNTETLHIVCLSKLHLK